VALLGRRLFSTQNYFDQHGVFASALWSAPLLFTAFVILLMNLRSTVDMLVVCAPKQLARQCQLALANPLLPECHGTPCA
jgi:hypothetical protein